MRSLWIGLCVGTLLVAGSCGGSSGGPPPVIPGPVILLTTPELEPNNLIGQATPLPSDRAGVGEVLFVGDVDYWSFSGTAGEVVQIEIFGTRFDQATWDSFFSAPRMRLFGPPGGLTLELDQHVDIGSLTPSPWAHGIHDLDIACFRIPVTGTYYICIEADNILFSGAKYAVKLNRLVLGTIQDEVEPNNSVGAADPIVPGTVHGFFSGPGATDYYSFIVTQPSIVYFEIKAERNGKWHGTDYPDPILTLRNPFGGVEFTNDDFYFYDSAMYFKIITPGTWTIQVTDFGGGTAAYPYFLTYALGGHGSVLDSEPNDSPGLANPIAYGDTVDGFVTPANEDWYSFFGTAGDMIQLNTFRDSNHETATDSLMDIVAPDGVTPVPHTSGTTLQVQTAILRTTGTHYVRVHDPLFLTDYCFELLALKRPTYETEPNDLGIQAEDLDADPARCGAGRIPLGIDIDRWNFGVTVNELVIVHIYGNRPLVDPFDDLFHGRNGFGSNLTAAVDSGGALSVYGVSLPFPPVEAAGIVQGLPTVTRCFVAGLTGTLPAIVSSEIGGVAGPDAVYVIERR